jgi:phosphate acetyltransferase
VSSNFQTAIRERARALNGTVVLPEGHDARTLDAAVVLSSEGLVTPIVLGPFEETRRALDERGGDRVRVVDPAAASPEYGEELQEARAHRGMTLEEARQAVCRPLVHGAMMVRRGEVDGFVAGADNATGDVLRAAFWCVGPEDGIRTVSSSFYMVVPDFRGDGEEILTFTDCAVVEDPTAEQLADIASAAATARRRIVGDTPRVAFLSYSTRGSAAGPSIQRVREGLRIFRDARPEIDADGELQADAALLPSVGRRKAPDSTLAGRANVLVFPDLDAGNIGYKLTQRLGGAAAVGPIVQGLRRPCNDLSRGASVTDIVEVACITALQALA